MHSKHSFVHLHLHTEYSKLDGECRIKPLIRQAQRYRMGALAVTDHGVMHGIYPLMVEAEAENGKLQKRIDRLKAKAEAAQSEEEKALWMRRAAFVAQHLVKPIAGCEAYMAPGSMTEKSDIYYHLILLAKNAAGYSNLCRITSAAYEKGMYRKPRMDMAVLRANSEGLIVSSACISGPIAKAVLADDYKQARDLIAEFKSFMGADFYLEIMLHPCVRTEKHAQTYANQMKITAGLILLSYETNTPLLVTNDVHFLRKEDNELHDFILCLSRNKKWNAPDRFTYSHEEYFKTGDEVFKAFADSYKRVAEYYMRIASIDFKCSSKEGALIPATLTQEEYHRLIEEGMANTVRIGHISEAYSLKRKPMMPKFDIPSGFSGEREYLRHLVYEGAKERWGTPLPASHEERLEFELSTIERMGFEGYFLIVWDFIREARARGIDVGPGRGSAAGSAVAYTLRITGLDPIEYDLLFERFLNPDRNELPDIDVDFDDSRRAEVIEYVREKYGAECVAGVAAFSRALAKGAIKDVARTMEMAYAVTAPIEKALKGVKKTAFKDIFKESKEVEELRRTATQEQRKVFDWAMRFEGALRAVSKHACGIIIGSEALSTYAPLFRAREKDEAPKGKGTVSEGDLLTVQYDGPVMEKIGFVKMDFLGLQTLQILRTAVKIIEKSKGITIHLDDIPLDDAETLALFGRGETVSLFQFESPGMQKYLKQLQPDSFSDLIAMNALYRPGPMDYINDFINRKHGRTPVTYALEEQKDTLASTYGITVYQEQVMQLSRRLANFTPGESDTLRKAMGKKKIQEMEKLKVKFLEGCQANGHPRKVVEGIWADWEKFSQYAFNKSHATCYAYLAFQTGYLKAHYPSEYMAANLEVVKNEPAKLILFIQECMRMGIRVLPPDVNESTDHFTVAANGDIRFGLTAIKKISSNAMEALAAERAAGGPFTDVIDLLRRVNPKLLNKATLELLAKSGALDSITPQRNRTIYLMAAGPADEKGNQPILIDKLIKFAQEAHNLNTPQQQSLFSTEQLTSTVVSPPEIPSIPLPADTTLMLNLEHELLGVYLSQHPLDEYRSTLDYLCHCRLSQLSSYAEANREASIIVGGRVQSVSRSEFTRKDGEKGTTVTATLEDFSGSHTFKIFLDNSKANSRLAENTELLQVGAKVYMVVSSRHNSDFLYTNDVGLLSDLKQHGFKSLEVTVKADDFDHNQLATLRDLLPPRASGAKLAFEIEDTKRQRSSYVCTNAYVAIDGNAIEQMLQVGLTFKLNGKIIQQNELMAVSDEEPLYDELENLND